MKRKWLHELPYLLIALYATKIGQAWRLAEGTDAAYKLLSLMDSLSASFASPLPSFELHDLCIGLLLGACFRLFIFIKESEKKKYRKGREYGSARWGTPEDIKPFIDPVFANNVILTQTERLTMNSRPEDPSNGAKQKRAGGRRFGQRQDEILRQTESHAMRVGEIPLLVRCDRPEGQPDRRVRQDAVGDFDYRIKVINTINFAKSRCTIIRWRISIAKRIS